MEAHKVELLFNAEVILGLLISIYQTVWAVCFESGPRESSAKWIPWVSRYNTVYCAFFVVPREFSVNSCLIPPPTMLMFSPPPFHFPASSFSTGLPV